MKKILFLLLTLLIPAGLSAQSYRYYKAQMHCHSTNSDGELSPEQVVDEYRNRGYEILFLTDHNVMSDIAYLSTPAILCINSEELTFDKHMNGFFLQQTIAASGFSPQQAIDSVKAQGGLIQFNHPVKTITGEDWSCNATQFLALHDLDLIEIHNWGTEFTMAPFNKLVWDSVLSAGYAVWGTATDDMHHLTEVVIPSINRGWVMIRLNGLNPDSVYSALKKGDFYSSTGVEITDYRVNGDTISVSCSECDEIKFIGDHGSVRKTVNAGSAEYVRGLDNYIRVVMEGTGGMMGTETIYAWTQPHFFISPHSIRENNLCSGITGVFPNPVSHSFAVSFHVESEGTVSLRLYDYNGRMVQTITDQGSLRPGDYTAFSNAGELATGMYFLVYTSGGFSGSKKVIVAR